jgi:3-oxoacyl-[acyl-carrier-protein] synthase-3
MPALALRALAAAGVGVEDLDAFIPHQANLRIVDQLVKTLKLPAHVVVGRDIVDTGNTSAASVPLATERLIREGQVASGALALWIGFGAGLAYAAQVVRLP